MFNNATNGYSLADIAAVANPYSGYHNCGCGTL